MPWRTDPEEQENWLSAANEHFDPARDMFMVEVDGTLVANADTEWVDTTDGLREYRMGCMVDPAWRRRGIGTWLQRTLEAHVAALAAANPTERPLAMGSWAADSESDRIALLTRFGFQPARYFFDMVRPALDEIEEPVLPERHRAAAGDRGADAPAVGGGHRGVPATTGAGSTARRSASSSGCATRSSIPACS